jgi:hypothetical protein
MQDKLESEVAEDARTSLKAQLMRKNPRCGMLINTLVRFFLIVPTRYSWRRNLRIIYITIGNKTIDIGISITIDRMNTIEEPASEDID